MDKTEPVDLQNHTCRNCRWWNGEPDDKKQQFCDLKEDYTGPGGWCARYSGRSRNEREKEQ